MSDSEVGRGFLSGVLGGVAGLLAMRFYWRVATALEGQDPRRLTTEKEQALDEMSVMGQQHEEEEASTAAVGRMAYENITGVAPSAGQKTILSNAVHWTYGLTMGGIYGAVREAADGVDVPGGLAFGSALWLLGDELMVPLLGLSQGPTAFPVKQHVHRFGAHLAYGLATSATTQLLYRLARPHRRSRWTWTAARTYATWKGVKALAKTIRR